MVVLTGAGISAESGLKTFRDSDGLWEGYNVYDVATPEAWLKNPAMVQEFYNLRRKAVLEAHPNAAHFALTELEKEYEVTIITQNIDDLHERAGSTNIIHLHGEIKKSQSTFDKRLVYDIDGWELKMGEICELGRQLRPFIVWFGEPVPMIEEAANIASEAEIFVVVGTSLVVYPAAGLLNYVNDDVPVYIVDPGEPAFTKRENVFFIREKATTGMLKLVEILK
ncbi:MAG: NAD-dependent deacylase [Bacteroidia bacterium]